MEPEDIAFPSEECVVFAGYECVVSQEECPAPQLTLLFQEKNVLLSQKNNVLFYKKTHLRFPHEESLVPQEGGHRF